MYSVRQVSFDWQDQVFMEGHSEYIELNRTTISTSMLMHKDGVHPRDEARLKLARSQTHSAEELCVSKRRNRENTSQNNSLGNMADQWKKEPYSMRSVG